MAQSFIDAVQSNGMVALALSAALFTGACAGTSAPTSPSAATLSGASAVTEAKGGSQPLAGTAAFQFVDTGGGIGGFASGTLDGVWGRFVTLTGDIVGTNFEPGTCHAGVDTSLGFPTFCVVFGDGPGQFTRLRAGGTAFTTCECTVGGVGEAGDQVILKISYPPATPPIYPYSFTKFAFQDGTGALQSLTGQGTLDFAVYPQASFTYRFAGQS